MMIYYVMTEDGRMLIVYRWPSALTALKVARHAGLAARLVTTKNGLVVLDRKYSA